MNLTGVPGQARFRAGSYNHIFRSTDAWIFLTRFRVRVTDESEEAPFDRSTAVLLFLVLLSFWGSGRGAPIRSTTPSRSRCVSVRLLVSASQIDKNVILPEFPEAPSSAWWRGGC